MAQHIPDHASSEAVGDLIFELARHLRRSVMDHLDVPGVTPGRLRALRHLERSAGAVRMGELAIALGMVPRSATTVVDELATAGLVRRRPDPEDRRATLVEMTAEGEGLLHRAKQVRRTVIADTFAALSPAEISQLRSLLDRALTSRSPQDHQGQ